MWHPNLNDEVRHAGPLDRSEAGDETLARISSERGALPALGESASSVWRKVSFPGAAWCNVSPPSRPYTEMEKRLVKAERACEVVVELTSQDDGSGARGESPAESRRRRMREGSLRIFRSDYVVDGSLQTQLNVTASKSAKRGG